jgi:hypothetical protein
MLYRIPNMAIKALSLSWHDQSRGLLVSAPFILLDQFRGLSLTQLFVLMAEKLRRRNNELRFLTL